MVASLRTLKYEKDERNKNYARFHLYPGFVADAKRVCVCVCVLVFGWRWHSWLVYTFDSFILLTKRWMLRWNIFARNEWHFGRALHFPQVDARGRNERFSDKIQFALKFKSHFLSHESNQLHLFLLLLPLFLFSHGCRSERRWWFRRIACNAPLGGSAHFELK